MRKINRGIAAAVLSTPLVLGMTGVAAADSFEQTESSVGPEGASTSQVSANTNGDGQASFEESQATAGPDGASSSSTESSAGGSDESGGLLGLGLLG